MLEEDVKSIYKRSDNRKKWYLVKRRKNSTKKQPSVRFATRGVMKVIKRLGITIISLKNSEKQPTIRVI